MEYEEWPAPTGIQHLVRCCWSLHAPAGRPHVDAAEPALPDGCPELILNAADPWLHVTTGGPTHGTVREQPLAFLVGQITGPFTVQPRGTVDLLAVRFEPHGAAALTRDLSAITDSWKSLDALHRDAPSGPAGVLLALHGLWQRLPHLSRSARRQQLEQWLSAYAAVSGHADDAVQGMVRVIVQSRGATPIDEAAVHAAGGVHLRTLQRRFTRQVGVSPKRLARFVRFHQVCQAWRRDPESLARVAADCGYCDESHLVRDFRAFVGEPPAAFLRVLPAFAAQFL